MGCAESLSEQARDHEYDHGEHDKQDNGGHEEHEHEHEEHEHEHEHGGHGQSAAHQHDEHEQHTERAEYPADGTRHARRIS